MDKKQFNAEMAAMRSRHKVESDELIRNWALANNIVKIGDIVTDEYDTIEVNRINVQYFSDGTLPYCHYRGMLLKKDLTPRKDQQIAGVSQESPQFRIVKAK